MGAALRRKRKRLNESGEDTEIMERTMTDEDVGQEPCPNSNTLAAQLRNVAQRFATHLTLEDIMRLSLGALSIEAATEIERLESCVRVARNQIHERDDWSIKFAAMKQRAEAAEAELAFRANQRRHISTKTKLAAALLALGHIEYEHSKQMSADQIISLYHFDHGILHAINPINEPWNLTPRLISDHREKSRKDTGIVAKTKRLGKAHAEHKRSMANALTYSQVSDALEQWANEKRSVRNKKRYQWPKRPFPKAHRPLSGKR